MKASVNFLLDFGGGRIFKKGWEVEILKKIERVGLNPIYRVSSPLYPGETFTFLEGDFSLLRRDEEEEGEVEAQPSAQAKK